MRELLAVGLGGFLGALARYGLWGASHRLLGHAFPFGTAAVNLVGCVAIGVLMGLFHEQSSLRPETRLFLQVGFLGSLTTFSAFGYETFDLLRDERVAAALASAALNVVGGLLAVAGGWAAARALAAA